MRSGNFLGFRPLGGGFRLRLVVVLGRLGKRHVGQRMLEYLVYPFHRNYRQLVLDVLRNFGQVLLVVPRNQDRLDTTAMRGQQLLLKPANRQNLTAQSDLASADTRAVHMPTPALGPSFGVAPSGT